MNMQSNFNELAKATEMIQSSRYCEALGIIREYLNVHPKDFQALYQQGLILQYLGYREDALRCFSEAWALQNNNPDIAKNLAEAYLNAGKPCHARQIFHQMQQMNILGTSMLNRTANIFLDRNKKAEAINMLLWSLSINPQQDNIADMAGIVKSRRPKIAFFCGTHGTDSIQEIAEFVKNRFPVRFFEGQAEQELYDLMNWSDISWFEWCNELIVETSRLPKNCRMIVRLHQSELDSDWPRETRWENVHALFLQGNPAARQRLLYTVPDIENRTRLINFGGNINLEKCRFVERTRGKNIACIDPINAENNPMLLLQSMQKLHYIDSEYKLYFSAPFENEAVESYVRHMVQLLGLDDVVFFHSPVEDFDAWLGDKHFVVSAGITGTSITQLLECMARGLKVILHNYPEASKTFPPEHLFNISEEFCKLIQSEDYQPKKYRRFIEDNYAVHNHFEIINDLLTEIESSMISEQPERVYSSKEQSFAHQ